MKRFTLILILLTLGLIIELPRVRAAGACGADLVGCVQSKHGAAAVVCKSHRPPPRNWSRRSRAGVKGRATFSRAERGRRSRRDLR